VVPLPRDEEDETEPAVRTVSVVREPMVIEQTGRIVRVGLETTLVEDSSGRKLVVPNESIKQVRAGPSWAVVEAAAIVGLAVGAFAGGLIGYKTHPCTTCYDVGPEGYGMGGALLGGLVGRFAGFVVGDMATRSTYAFGSSSAE
jgi:hypothetical protein